MLVVDANLEASGAPVHKLDAPLGLDGGDGRVDVFGDNVSPVEHAAGHVLAMAGVALHHLVGGLEAGVGDLRHAELLVVSLLGGDDEGVGDQAEVDPGVGDQVGLELSQVHVESSVKSERGGKGGDDLTNQTVKVGVSEAVNVPTPHTDVVDGLIVHHEGAVVVLQSGVGGQDGGVGLHHGSGHLGGRVNSKLQLGLLAIIHREPLHQKISEPRAGATTKAVEDEKSLEPSALVN